MSSFNTTCVPWIDTRACSSQMKKQFSILCYVSLVCTIVGAIAFIASTMRRFYYKVPHTTLFKLMIPNVALWCVLQCFYLVIHGFFSSNYSVPSSVLTFCHLMSSAVLGIPQPQVIVTWAESYKLSISLKKVSYHIPYAVIASIFTVLSIVFSVLAGISPNHYFIWMRVILGVWSLYLAPCCVLLLYTGLKIYRVAGKSSSKTDDNTWLNSAQWSVIKILVGLVVCVFVPAVVVFITYIVFIREIESHKFASLIVWYSLNISSACVVAIWAHHFWQIPPDHYSSNSEDSQCSNLTFRPSHGASNV